jgi:hypothetical protein
MSGAVPPLRHVFMAWCFIKYKDNFTLPTAVGGVVWELVPSINVTRQYARCLRAPLVATHFVITGVLTL